MLANEKWDQKPLILDEIGTALIKAADYIEKYGWCQHSHSKAGTVCLWGAICEANGGDGRLCDDAYDKVETFLQNPIGAINWNDAPGRTKDEVIALLRKAAVMA
jgi:hypothetical protein